MGRIGILGGTFDPPHLGHLAVAQAAADRLSLDRILLAPTGVQPLKLHRRLAPFADRCAMTELLAQLDGRLGVSRLDAPRGDGKPNFTVDLLRKVLRSVGPADTLFNIVGADAFASLPQWRDPRELLRVCAWIVVSRPGEDVYAEVANTLKLLDSADVADGVHIVDGVANPVSATLVRDRIEQQFPWDEMVPPSILEYIAAHQLYQPFAQ